MMSSCVERLGNWGLVHLSPASASLTEVGVRLSNLTSVKHVRFEDALDKREMLSFELWAFFKRCLLAGHGLLQNCRSLKRIV